MSDALLARLEAAIARLEKLGGAAAVDAVVTGGDDDITTPAGRAAIAAYEEFYNQFVPPTIAACKAFDDLKEIAEFIETSFKNQGDLIKAAAVSKKASDADLLAFLKPSADVIQKSEKMNFKSAQYTHQQAFNASIGVLSWPFAQPPSSHIETMIDSASLYLNRILTKAKDAEEPQKTNDRTFVAAYKALLTGFFDYVKKHFKAGLEWNNIKGKPLSEYKNTGAAAPAAAAAPAPTAASAPVTTAKPAAAGMASVFGEISKGLAITSGLNKVTDDMKTKNMKDVPPVVVVPKAAPAPKPAAVAAPAVKKAPVLENKNGTWFVEHHEANNSIELKDVSIRDSVYLGNIRNSTVRITGKPKSIALDKCFRTTVIVDDTLSSIEFVNTDRCTLYINGSCPTIAIDKSKGVIVNLSAEAIARNPDIITSNISECNVQIPGPSEEENIIEIPLPEQYLSKLGGRKLTTNPVSHG